MIKRLTALALFIILSPFFLLASLLIKIGSDGPVFFRQKRAGKNKKPFTMYKFRTMVIGAEKLKSKIQNLNEVDGPVFKIRNDPRYTAFGKFLSHLGLDEGPQLVNVFRGEMDFVGPRPLPIPEAQKVPKIYEKRFSVLPGITSPWIIKGAHNLSFNKWMELDVDYVEQKSFLYDSYIFLMTVGLIMSWIMRKILRSGRSFNKLRMTIGIILLLLGMTMRQVFAAEANNIYGIHLAQPHSEDIKAAADLVNSEGGDWGYITLVVQENDRNLGKWQEIFDELRRLHLIPIIRLATQPEGENWRRPEASDAQNWVDFLNSLNWVTKNRYVILFNEPNHGSEWGGEVDEGSYAVVATEFAKKLKEKNKDFFVMLAGFDASAPSFYPGLEDETVFLREMLRQVQHDTVVAQDDSVNLFDYIDGWASHSYPNPGFSGTPWDYGRGTIRTYQWELDLLRSLGVDKELPVFITETGWRRGNETTVANYLYSAYNDLWSQDARVWAVTPFVLDYQGPPFLEFSWKKYNSQDFYQQYFTVQSLPKIKGDPAQVQKGKIDFKLPHELVVQSKYDFRISLANNGQAIWDKNDDYTIQITEDGVKASEVLISDLKAIEPFQEKSVDFSLKTSTEGTQNVKFILTKNGESILESKPWNFNILPLPSLRFTVNFFPFFKGQGDNFEVQIFDADERLVFKKKGVKVESGRGEITNIQNIALGEKYRAVVLKPGYLPRQNFLVFKKESNFVKFKSMLGIDFNGDGKFEPKDLFYFLVNFSAVDF